MISFLIDNLTDLCANVESYFANRVLQLEIALYAKKKIMWNDMTLSDKSI